MLQSTRLFPKNTGASGYKITGIAAQCDWVLLSDWKAPQTYLHRNEIQGSPRHVFLSLRAPFPALAAFIQDVLPQITAPFVLVSGSEDCTIPRQTDHRWRAFSADENKMIAQLLDHPLLLHWFAENLVETDDPRFSPLPVGMVYPDGIIPEPDNQPVPRQHERPHTVLCGHRVRDGLQWDVRLRVNKLAQGVWSDFCSIPDTEVPEQEFQKLMREHAFVLCAEGGGVDPSPKAWQAILNGAIPIIRKTGVSSAYEELPVAIVEEWEAAEITQERLAYWHSSLLPFFDDAPLRAQTLKKLELAYWWEKITPFVREPNHR